MSKLTMSCAFATQNATPEHARIAEELGYARAWFYDSPALYPDVWVQLCRAADRTKRIVLGTGVLVPHLRHPMATAAAIGTLVEAAGAHRVIVGVGSGFTARVAMGQRPLTWAYVTQYTRTVQALLRGEDVEWEGAMIRMLQWEGCTVPRPIEVPWVVAAGGPKGVAAAKEVAQGVFAVSQPIPGFESCVVLTLGTVLDPGESPGSTRAIEAAGHGAAVLFHYALEHRMLEMIPNGEAWKKAYEQYPQATRHLEMHHGHLVAINHTDRPFITGELLAGGGMAMDAGAWRARIEEMEAKGATEVAYQPGGPDIPRELEAFARMMRR
ncbi:MAG TPA: LLM class flavin-dependent oxidoreductase [Nevskiaceae bacterium]|nr:LLM class flavin-dependent oxidoreductase [Nevskiaceae bacterium]